MKQEFKVAINLFLFLSFKGLSYLIYLLVFLYFLRMVLLLFLIRGVSIKAYAVLYKINVSFFLFYTQKEEQEKQKSRIKADLT